MVPFSASHTSPTPHGETASAEFVTVIFEPSGNSAVAVAVSRYATFGTEAGTTTVKFAVRVLPAGSFTTAGQVAVFPASHVTVMCGASAGSSEETDRAVFTVVSATSLPLVKVTGT